MSDARVQDRLEVMQNNLPDILRRYDERKHGMQLVGIPLRCRECAMHAPEAVGRSGEHDDTGARLHPVERTLCGRLVGSTDVNGVHKTYTLNTVPDNAIADFNSSSTLACWTPTAGGRDLICEIDDIIGTLRGLGVPAEHYIIDSTDMEQARPKINALISVGN